MAEAFNIFRRMGEEFVGRSVLTQRIRSRRQKGHKAFGKAKLRPLCRRFVVFVFGFFFDPAGCTLDRRRIKHGGHGVEDTKDTRFSANLDCELCVLPLSSLC